MATPAGRSRREKGDLKVRSAERKKRRDGSASEKGKHINGNE